MRKRERDGRTVFSDSRRKRGERGMESLLKFGAEAFEERPVHVRVLLAYRGKESRKPKAAEDFSKDNEEEN